MKFTQVLTFLVALSSEYTAASQGAVRGSSLVKPLRKLAGSGSKSKLVKKDGEATDPVEEVQHRAVIQARVTIPGVDTDDLTAGESLLVERCMVSAFSEVHSDVDHTHIENMIVVNPTGDERRKLEAKTPIGEDHRGRSLYWWYTWSYNGYGSDIGTHGYYDAWAIVDVTCSYCADEDSDWRRLETDAQGMELHQALEEAVCDCLAAGPFDTFNDAHDCHINYFEV